MNALVEQCGNMIEAKYLLHHLLNSLVEKGLLCAKAEYDKKVIVVYFKFDFKFDCRSLWLEFNKWKLKLTLVSSL